MAKNSYLRFLECLDRIDSALRRAEDLDQMMKDVLDEMLSIFQSDRAWLLYPCDPEAPSWGVPMERVREGFPGALSGGKNIPMLEEAREVFRNALVTKKPVAYDPSTKHSLPEQAAREFNIRSQVTVAIYPKRGLPWLLGMHQCSHARIWNEEDRNLLHEIGRRVADALNSMVLLKDLRESEEKHRTILESMKEGVYICSPDLIIEYMNPAMIERLGRNATGEKCHLAIYLKKNKCSWCIYDKIKLRESIEYELKNPIDGRFYAISNFPMEQSDGLISKLSISRDITEIKKMRDQLLRTQKMESIGNLAGGIAHDFNNLLSPIIGMSELLLGDLPKGSQEHDSVKTILAAGIRSRELIKQILAFSRQSDQEKVPVRLQKVMKEVVELSRSSIPSYIEITSHIQMNCGLVMADQTQIHQVAMNLITNAYHASDNAGGKISIVLKETVIDSSQVSGKPISPGKYAMIQISDSGCGIDPAIMDKIFEPYFTTKEKEKGTGLGLAVVYGIIHDHGGSIEVESEPDKGTTFRVYIPLMTKSNDFELFKNSETIPAGNERVLLVDDEAMIADIEKQILERLGYTVEIRTSSLDALDTFRSSPDEFDLVITDMTMPNMTGDKLAKELIVIRPDIPVIMCTGFSERTDAERAKSIGIKGFLMKPLVLKEIAQTVRKVLDEAKSNNQG